jgi:hypothetical protein
VIDVDVINSVVYGTDSNCLSLDISPLFGTDSTSVRTITSNGGNISDDGTCSTFFNQASDQNYVTNLATTLGSISDNGGYVPTIPLHLGSPAIDAGITVVGLNTDARLTSRPQGLAFDSGAYEYVPVTSTVNTPQTTETLADTGNSQVNILAVSLIILMSSGYVLKSFVNFG